jgi:phosphoglycolate phosphatase-like HAD superfamily hydrolase
MRKQCGYLAAVLLVAAIGLQARAQEAKPAQRAAAMSRACIIDMDGTIADESARRAKAEAEHPREKDKSGYYKLYFSPELIATDKPIEKSREVLAWVSAQGIDIYYVSSRSQGCLKASMKWLEDNKFPKGKWVYHRKGFARTLDFKIETIKEIQRKADVLFAVGDRSVDAEAATSCGVKAITVEANSNKDWERVKTEIAKILAEKK